MRITNHFNLPQPFVDAVSYDDYTSSGSDFTTTGLIKPVRISVLFKKHFANLEQDASEMVWRLSGQAKHVVLERIAKRNPERYLVEKRLFIDVDGYKVSGQIDLLDRETKTLHDWKETSIWQVIKNDQEEWICQGNINFYIATKNGYEIEHLSNIAFMKDWKKRQAVKRDYPPVGIQACPLPIWPAAKTEQFIRDRIQAHIAGQDKLPLCSSDERWESPHQWAVMKKGAKRAVRNGLHDTEEGAVKHAGTIDGARVEERPGENTRCLFYCPVVAQCDFGRELIREAAGA